MKNLLATCVALGIPVLTVTTLAWATPMTLGQAIGWVFTVLLGLFLILVIIAVFEG